MSTAPDLAAWRSGLADWLETMARGLEPGRFRYCASGSHVPTSGHAAHFATCFAVKAAWQSGIWDTWSPERRDACLAFIRSFQQPDGWFVDPWLQCASRPTVRQLASAAVYAALGRRPLRFLLERQEMNLRAETRQSAGTLLMVGAEPEHPLPFPWRNERDVLCFVRGLNWATPWSAGSHLSHLVFLLKALPSGRVQSADAERILDQVAGFLNQTRDDASGTWFTGQPAEAEKLNGAMKVLTALDWLGRPWPDCTRLVAFALRQPTRDDGCGFLNRLHVVYLGLRGCPVGYMDRDVCQCAEDSLRRIDAFRKPDGGFSFYEHRAQTGYYGARVSDGRCVSDLHGAAMMAWATSICVALLGLGGSGHVAQWKVHRA